MARSEQKLSNSQRKLSKFAAKFERDNGLTITEGRLANANKRSQGEDVDAKRKPRNVHECEKAEETTDRRRDLAKVHHNDKAKEIQERTTILKAVSATEWDALKQSYYAQKDAIKSQMSPAFKELNAEIRALFKPYWADMFKRQRQELRTFESGDRTANGKIWHGAAAFRVRRAFALEDGLLQGVDISGVVGAFPKTLPVDGRDHFAVLVDPLAAPRTRAA